MLGDELLGWAGGFTAAGCSPSAICASVGRAISSDGVRKRLVAAATGAVDAFAFGFTIFLGASSMGSGAGLSCLAHEAQN